MFLNESHVTSLIIGGEEKQNEDGRCGRWEDILENISD
jgi:hypothetical protein